MATPQALTAVIRASKPDFTSTVDKVAFAIHSILSVNGFSLRKFGKGVDEAVSQDVAALPTEDPDLVGWNQEVTADGGIYSFLYLPEPGVQRSGARQSHGPSPPPVLLLKCLKLAAEMPSPATIMVGVGTGGAAAPCGGDGGVLLVSLADVSSDRPPVSFELSVDRYAPSLAPGASGYEHLEELIRRVQEALGEVLEEPATTSGRAGAAETSANARSGRAAATAAATAAARTKQEVDDEDERARRLRETAEERRRRDPLRDERYAPGIPTRGPPGWVPMGVGDEDLMPGGIPFHPGLGGLGGIGGVPPLGPRGVGGGMHVGPGNPIFADRLRHPRVGPGFPPGVGGGVGGGAVPGMRWDPISPEGLQGWSPDDYTRAGRAQRGEGFNDIGQPPPGRGPDWDHMFG